MAGSFASGLFMYNDLMKRTQTQTTLFSVVILASLVLSTVPTKVTAQSADQVAQLQAIAEYLERTYTLPSEPLSLEEMQRVILAGADWMVAAKEEDGGFGYEYLPFEGEYSDDNAMVRQSGTFYALAEVYRAQGEKDEAIKLALEESIRYFRAHTQSVEGGQEVTCVYNGENDRQCRLGASALTLLGLLSYAQADPEVAVAHGDLIDQYKAYILSARLGGAGFSDAYHPRRGYSDRESPFFNGEAMLALARYYAYEPDEEVATVFEQTFTYLFDAPQESPLYLWMMAALKEATRHWEDERYQVYAYNFTKEQVSRSKRTRGTSNNYCAPAEGLSSAYSVVQSSDDQAFVASLKAEIDFWLARSTVWQLDKNRPYRVVADGDGLTLKKIVDPEKAHGGFLAGEDRLFQRIDATQHCISAYLQVYKDVYGASL